MSEYIIQEKSLVDIANAVRAKTRTTDKMHLSDMPEAIMTIFSSIVAESTTFTKDGNVVTESSVLDTGAVTSTTISFDDNGVPILVKSNTRTLTIEMMYDENGHPSALVINGGKRVINWEGFEAVPADTDLTAQQSFMMGYGLGITGGELPVNLKDGESDG